MSYQTTLGKSVAYTGIGLHSGRDVTITLQPAPADTGIVFVRTDLPGAPRVKATAANVTSTLRATTIEDGAAKVFTVEHLLAVFFAMGIDNCLVEITAAEPPVGDGSSLPFVSLVEEAGIAALAAPCRYTPLPAAQVVRFPDKFIAILPYDGLRVSFTSVNPHPLIGIQYGDFEISTDTFIREIAPARTIGFMHEVEALQAQGLALGGSLENAVVYDGDKILTPLRFPDELVRHKILDVLGDLALVGRIRGHVVAVKSSHALNTALAKQIAASAQK
ncbi:UDP-3-O-acyl-N-acetylglucosamine deacetylase [Anaeroselena agilis]|uniref:UDP-3-O-acyl-N-acetylglucosamine deacetylase n=1 Tax=Anaeroselena agilis TaxID=3063788 RepID=A0ABU3P446_9FIRM|nr:UDP-3-O-acyl-N-acetylglucosamine deacetylase [Selenomonadales bacterium 4137-cl]